MIVREDEIYFIKKQPDSTLSSLLSTTPLSESHLWPLFTPIALALDHTHSQSLTHGDLSPHHILLSKNKIQLTGHIPPSYKKGAK
jgi:serine/threonine protein kinase